MTMREDRYRRERDEARVEVERLKEVVATEKGMHQITSNTLTSAIGRETEWLNQVKAAEAVCEVTQGYMDGRVARGVVVTHLKAWREVTDG